MSRHVYFYDTVDKKENHRLVVKLISPILFLDLNFLFDLLFPQDGLSDYILLVSLYDYGLFYEIIHYSEQLHTNFLSCLMF